LAEYFPEDTYVPIARLIQAYQCCFFTLVFLHSSYDT